MEDLELKAAKKMVQIQHSAKDRNIPFSMTFRRIKQLIKQEKCFYTGIDLEDEVGPNQRTFDRIDATKGYTDKNVVACCSDINNKKANLSVAEIHMIYHKIKNR